MNGIDKTHEVLKQAFQYFKISDQFNLSDYELKQNLCILFQSVISGNLEDSKRAQYALFDLSKIDQHAFLCSFLHFIDKELIEKINQNNIAKNELQEFCSNNILTTDDYINLVKNIYSLKNTFSIGEPLPSEISISKQDAIYYFDLIIEIIQSGEWRLNALDNKTNITNLYIAYNCIRIAEKDFYYFYKLCDLTIELMNHTGDLQLARDTAEQIHSVAIKDGNAIYAVYIKANCYLMQKNTTDALIYLCTVVNNLNDKLSFDFWKNLLTRIQIFYRDLGIESLEINLFNNLKKNITCFDTRTRDQIFFSHFTLLFTKENDVSQDVFNYLSTNREDIFSIGIDAFKIWYCFLQQLYNKFNNESLQLYITEFKRFLPSDVLTTINNAIGLIVNDKLVINSIVKQLINSKYNDDRNSEIKRNLLALHKLLDKSFISQDSNLFLNVSRLLSGVQYIAPENDYEGPVFIKYEEEKLENYYDKFVEDFNKIDILNYFDLILLEKSGKNIYLHSITKEKRLFIKPKITMQEIIDFINNLPSNMTFDEKDDYEKQVMKKDRQIEKSQIFDFDIKYSKPYIVISNTDLSLISSNLFVSNNTFISNIHKSLNMPSLDFMIHCKEIEIKNNVQLWCPLEKGDMALNCAFHGIEDYLKNNNISYEITMIPENKLSSDISIIIAHGGDDIAYKQYFSAGWFGGEKTTFYTDITKVIEKSKLIILCICHSGKATKNLMYESSQSMQESLFKIGAQAVIAPKWPLNTEIIGLWLPFFLDTLKNGKTSFEAFSETQEYVFEKHPNAGAWACLHYFGNPNIRIGKEDKK